MFCAVAAVTLAVEDFEAFVEFFVLFTLLWFGWFLVGFKKAVDMVISLSFWRQVLFAVACANV